MAYFLRHRLSIYAAIFILQWMTPIVSSQSVMSSTSSSASTDTATNIEIVDHLDTLSNDALEEICTSRGFELVKEKDEMTGEWKAYTHEEYVDAARQCMEIEAEMEKLLEENPDLLNEIEAESERMLKEREQLEKELAEVEAQLMAEREKSRQRFTSAFIKDVDEGIEQNANDTHISTEDNIEQGREEVAGAEDENEVIDLDQDHMQGRKLNAESSSASTASIDSSFPHVEQQAKKKIELVHNADNITNKFNETTLPTIQEVCQEVMMQVQRDIKMLGKIILPEPVREPLSQALKPVIKVARNSGSRALDIMRRYVKVMLNDSIIQALKKTRDELKEKIIGKQM